MTAKSPLKKVLMTCLMEAGKIIRKGYGKNLTITKKTPISIVTDIDVAADKKILKILSKNFPDHQTLTEESKPVQGSSPYRWIIDPLDGTTNFAHNVPICCVSIGLEYKGEIIMGGVYNPLLEELFFAEKGKGATLNGKPIMVSKNKELINCLVATGFPYDRRERAGLYLQFIKSIIEKCQGIRRLGAAALDLCFVACGRFDVYWEFNINPWDIAAGVLILKEAGGKVTDLNGNPIDINRPHQLLSTNRHIHPPIQTLFRQTFSDPLTK